MPTKKRPREKVQTSLLSMTEAPPPTRGLSPAQGFGERPWEQGERKGQFQAAQLFAESVGSLRTLLRLKRMLFNYGWQLRAVNPDGQPAVEQWLANGNRARLRRLLDDVWRDQLALANVVVSWMEMSDFPYTLQLEDCDYRNRCGREELKWRHGLEPKELDEWTARVRAELSPAAATDFKRRYERGVVVLGDEVWNAKYPSLASFFRVLTEAPVGKGFGPPSLLAVFQAADQQLSLEAGESGLAWLARSPLRQHVLGYDIKTGPAAGSAQGMPSKRRLKDTAGEFKGKLGPRELATPFDHEIGYVWVDPKYWDADKWASMEVRFMAWGGPLGHLLSGKTTEGLTDLLQTEATDERERLGLFLDEVLTGFAGVPVRLGWSDECFRNQRLFSEMLKFAAQTGVVSAQTVVDTVFSPGRFALEEARKRGEMERAAATPGLYVPHFDPAHGNRPGAEPGRPMEG